MELQGSRLEQYARMVEIREFEECVNALFAKGLIHGTTHLCSGHEALAVGLAAVLRTTDIVSATYRGHGVALALGMTPRTVMAEIMGKVKATAFGATPSQRLWKVELPYAFPQIMAGLNQTIMLSLSMVVIAAYVGADGLGKPVVQALSRVDTSLGFESGFVIVVVAIVLDRMLRVTRK